jgi:hypothetical protein
VVIAAVAASILLRGGALSTLPATHLIGAGLALSGSAVALLGYWRLQRWGLWLILLVAAARMVSGLVGVLPPLSPSDFLWPAVIVAIGLAYHRRLN